MEDSLKIPRWMIGVFAAALVWPAAKVLFGGNAAWAAPCGPEVEVWFVETDGDFFVIKNKSREGWSLVSLIIRLTGSRGRVVFDTAEGGPGASMSHPFQPIESDVGFLGATPVGDGDEQVRLEFSDFAPGREFMFMIDVDDRLENSEYGQAIVSGDEIEGASAEAVLMTGSGAKSKAYGRFGNDARARLRGGLCA